MNTQTQNETITQIQIHPKRRWFSKEWYEIGKHLDVLYSEKIARGQWGVYFDIRFDSLIDENIKALTKEEWLQWVKIANDERSERNEKYEIQRKKFVMKMLTR